MEPIQAKRVPGDESRGQPTLRNPRVSNVKFIENNRTSRSRGYGRRRNGAQRATTDELFRKSYQNQSISGQNLGDKEEPETQKKVSDNVVSLNRFHLPKRKNQTDQETRKINERPVNPDWLGSQKEVLQNNATVSERFNASYQKQGVQPQGLNTAPTEKESDSGPRQNRSRFSRINDNSTQKAKYTRGRQKAKAGKGLGQVKNILPPPARIATTVLAKKSLAKGQVTASNSVIFLVGGKLWLLVQLPLAILCFFFLLVYFITNSNSAQIAQGLFTGAIKALGGTTGQFLMRYYDIDVELASIAFPLLLIFTLLVHLLGLFSLTGIYITYKAALLKPISGSKAILKQGAFAIALLGYSIPVLNLLPWGLLVMGVVWLYPE